MSFVLGALVTGVLGSAPFTQESNPAYQVRAKMILVGDGTQIEDGVMVVERGKVSRIGRGEIDPHLPLVEHAGVLAPGFVACQTESGEEGEGYEPTRSILPEARLVHAFHPDHSDFAAAARAGITTVVLAPSGNDLVGGLTAVVKTAGGVILEREGHLALSFGGSALSQTVGRSFGFGTADEDAQASASSDSDPRGGPEDTEDARRGSRQPTSYSGALRELRERFAKPQGVYSRAARGELPVLLEAWDRHEVMRAAEFARDHRLIGALRGAPLAGDPDVADSLAKSGLGVVVGPYAIGQRRRSLESVGMFQARGVPVAFALASPEYAPEGLRLSAALALSAGAKREDVLRALTTDAAKIAGVSDRLGSLERGKDADFVLWSGDPLDLSSRIESVWIDGKRVHARTDGMHRPTREEDAGGAHPREARHR